MGFSDLGLQSSNRLLDIHRGLYPTARVLRYQKTQGSGSASYRSVKICDWVFSAIFLLSVTVYFRAFLGISGYSWVFPGISGYFRVSLGIKDIILFLEVVSQISIFFRLTFVEAIF